MRATGIIRDLDKLNRLVIPMEITKALEFESKQSVQFFIEGSCIIISKYQKCCTFCDVDDLNMLVTFNDKLVCHDCVESIGKI